jgi:hypothetical protein
MEFGDPPMARRVLKGIKTRAERMDTASVAVAANSAEKEVKG